MPLEYLYTFAAQKTFEGDNGLGFVLLPPQGLTAEKDAKTIVVMTGHDNPSVNDPPSWAYSVHNGNCVLSYTFAIHNYRGRTDGEVSHFLFLDPTERISLPEGPVFAMENYTFIKTFDPINNFPRRQDSNQIITRNEPSMPFSAKDLKYWREYCGDIAWCGLIIENIIRDKHIFLIYDPSKTNGSEKILLLLKELYSVIPPELRWRVTFNTRVNTMDTVVHTIVGIEWPANQTTRPPLPPVPKGNGVLILRLEQLKTQTCPDSPWTEYIRTGQYSLDEFQSPKSISQREMNLASPFKLGGVSELANICLAKEKNLLTQKEVIDALQKDVDDRKEELERELKNLANNTAELEKTNADVCGELQKQETELAEEQERLRGELAQLQQELDRSKREIKERISESNRRLDDEITARTRDLGKRKEELDKRDGALESRKISLDKKEKEYNVWEQTLSQKRVKLQEQVNILSQSLNSYIDIPKESVKKVTPEKKTSVLEEADVLNRFYKQIQYLIGPLGTFRLIPKVIRSITATWLFIFSLIGFIVASFLFYEGYYLYDYFRLKILDNTIISKNDEIVKLENYIEEKTPIANQLDNDIKEKTSVANQLDNDIKEKTSVANQLDNGIKEKTSVANQLDNDIKEKTLKARQLDKEIVNRNSEKIKLNQFIDNNKPVADQLAKDIEVKKAGITELDKTLDEKQRHIKVYNEEIEKLQKEWETLRRDIPSNTGQP